MNIELIKRLASGGNTWAIDKLKELEQGNTEPQSETPSSNSIYNMVNGDNIRQDNKSKWGIGDKRVGFRIPEPLLNRLEQEKQIKCKTATAIILESLADYFYWLDKTNELRLEEVKRKIKENQV